MDVFTTYKQRGEWVELLFMAQAARRGFIVSKPWGDSAQYDVGIERGRRYTRVQVKGIERCEGSGYCALLHSGKRKGYTVAQADYLAIYLLPEDVWYIFPVSKVGRQRGVMMSPNQPESLHARYQGAWELLEKRNRTPENATAQPGTNGRHQGRAAGARVAVRGLLKRMAKAEPCSESCGT